MAHIQSLSDISAKTAELFEGYISEIRGCNNTTENQVIAGIIEKYFKGLFELYSEILDIDLPEDDCDAYNKPTILSDIQFVTNDREWFYDSPVASVHNNPMNLTRQQIRRCHWFLADSFARLYEFIRDWVRCFKNPLYRQLKVADTRFMDEHVYINVL